MAGSESAFRVLLGHELRSVGRDQRTIIFSVLLPLLVLPLLLLGMRETQERGEEAKAERTYAYSATPEQAVRVRELVERGLRRIEREPEASREPIPRLEFEALADPAAGLRSETIAAWVELRESDATPSVEQVHIVYRGNRERSSSAMSALRRVFEAARAEHREELLEAEGLDIEAGSLLEPREHDVAGPGRSMAADLGRYLVLGLVFFVLSGGQIVAADLVAGEKERGTLETLLTTAASRRDIVYAKLATIVIVAIVITAINIANLGIYVAAGLISGLEALSSVISPGVIVQLAIAAVPLTLVVASLLLIVSGVSRSYKEAQLLNFGLTFLLAAPAAISMLPNLPLRSAIAVVPIANTAVWCRELLAGRPDLLMLGVTTALNVVVGFGLARYAIGMLGTERLIAPEAFEGDARSRTPATFRVDVLRWAAGTWAAFMLLSLSTGSLDLRWQLFMNLVVLMLGGSVLVVWLYRMRPREVWALRRPPAMAWVVVLLGAPSGLVVTQGVYWLSSLVLPVPERMLEEFQEAFEASDIPTWQLLVLVSVLPGICEEIFFRGTILHGLRRRLHPVALCLVVGIIFGMFHVSLFRIFPTGFLGIVLAAVTLMTGSIFPAMLWHAAHNFLAFAGAEAGWSLETAPAWLVALAIVVFLGALGLAWRFRSPYPDLKTESGPSATG